MKKILYFLKDYKKESILAPLFKMLEAIFELIIPLVMAAIIDTGIAGNDKNYVIRMCMVMTGLGIIGLACSITAQFFAAKAAVGMASRLRHAVFSHIQNLSFSTIDQIGTSTLITRMTSDINQVQSGINLFLRLFLRSPFIVFGAMIMAFTVDVKAALIFAVTIPLLSLVVFGVMLVSIPLYKKVQNGLDEVLTLVRENLTGVRVIRAFHKEEEEISSFKRKNQMLNEHQQYVGKISALTNPVTYIIINAATLVLIWTGAVRVDTGYITQGEVVALVNYMSQILVELIKLANLIVSVTKAIACGKRVADILDAEKGLPYFDLTIDEKTDKIKSKQNIPKVAFRGVSMSYHGSGEYAVKEIDFQAGAGETIGIIGGTGSGKSTIVNLIPRFYDVTKGAVFVDGKDVRSYDIAQLRQKIGVVMQKAVLFKDMEIAEQILATDNVGKIKALGRAVKNYEEMLWNGMRQIIVYRGLLQKFDESAALKDKLLATRNSILAECAVQDKIWGTGLSMKDERRLDLKEWQGQNLLGFSLMYVRTVLR